MYPELGNIVEGREFHSDDVVGTAAALPDSIDRDGEEFRGRQLRSTADGIVADRLVLEVTSDRIETSGKILLGGNQRLASPLAVCVKRQRKISRPRLHTIEPALQHGKCSRRRMALAREIFLRSP